MGLRRKRRLARNPRPGITRPGLDWLVVAAAAAALGLVLGYEFGPAPKPSRSEATARSMPAS